ncbi:MAG: hypothetical protein MK137_05260 [Rickettsiales bacterium]|nr:hypothetical protein [Rickettsiales bacterium]
MNLSFRDAVSEHQGKMFFYIKQFSAIPEGGYTYITAYSKMEELSQKINNEKLAVLSKLYAMLPENIMSSSSKSKCTYFQQYITDEIDKVNASYEKFSDSYTRLIDAMRGVR